jgi:hypothetical protein
MSMSISMIATKDMRYRTRHLKAGDGFRVKNEREARVLTHMKKAERGDSGNRKVALDDVRASVGLGALSKDSEDIKAVRDEYEAKVGKRPFNGWSIETLKEKIAEA